MQPHDLNHGFLAEAEKVQQVESLDPRRPPALGQFGALMDVRLLVFRIDAVLGGQAWQWEASGSMVTPVRSALVCPASRGDSPPDRRKRKV